MANTEMNLENIPVKIRALVGHEATRHRRSISQEIIALLEEALIARGQRTGTKRDGIDEILQHFDSLPTRDPKPLSEMIDYDELGLPK